MLRLVGGEDLDEIEVVERALRLGPRRHGAVREAGDDVQGFEHVAGEIGGAGARGEGKRDRACPARVDNRGDRRVEGKGLAPSGSC